MMESGEMIKLMGMEYILTPMARNMREIGKKISKMEKERNPGRMGHLMKENISRVKNVEMEFLNGWMVVNMMENLVIITLMVKVYILGGTRENI